MSAELDVGVSVVLGGQWGDEGKGKLVDMLAAQADYVCRCQVGSPYAQYIACIDQTSELHSCI